MRIYIGHDSREQAAWNVAASTASSFGCEVLPVFEDTLRATGILTRPVDRRGRMWDLNSSAPQSTEFAISRFAIPMLAHAGVCLGVDCDVVFMDSPHRVVPDRWQEKAVWVVKHPPLMASGMKMDGQHQVPYPRKNWSSVILWNCDHPANRRLNLTTLNQLPGRELHAFCWLNDEEIGELPPEANWLVGIQPKPRRPIIAHFTEGGPWIPNWTPREHDELWTEANQR